MVQGYATSTKPMAYHGAVQDLMLLVADILTNTRNAVLPQLFQRLLPPEQEKHEIEMQERKDAMEMQQEEHKRRMISTLW